MKLYAEMPVWRVRQQVADAAAVAWVVVWVWVGNRIYELVDALQGPGRSAEAIGLDTAARFEDGADGVGQVPAAGDALRRPFEAVAEGSRSLAEAGASQQELVHDVAVALGVVVAVIPIAYLVLKYVPGRVRWIREASAAKRLRIDAADLQLFALRAVATRPLYELQRACADPAAALAGGDYAPLAALELGALGLRVPEAGASHV